MLLGAAMLAALLAAGAVGSARAQAVAPGSTPPSPAELGGARVEPTQQLQGATLVLNGAGVRFKAVFKVYAAALYLGSRAGTPEAVLAAPGPKRLQVTMLRDIDANELGRLFTRGIEENAPREDFLKSIGGIARMGEVFAAKKRLAAGEQFSIDWLPGSGTLVRINGKPAADPVPEPEFFASLMRIWLGRAPADAQLKESLLGRPPARPRSDPFAS